MVSERRHRAMETREGPRSLRESTISVLVAAQRADPALE